ncbi:hypothetical protein K0B04_01055 [Patescibacteria group bacterium]|nr:hypothetical protein [Patescibacteria group bacterium]
MTLKELKEKIKTPIFTRTDISKAFSHESKEQINTQLYRFRNRGEVIGIKRELFMFPDSKIDELVIANKLYSPSYVSLEYALNIYGVIPDIPSTITSITTVTSKKFDTEIGKFSYSKVNSNLFFGYKSVLDEQSNIYYNIASIEKALLDYIYVRRIKDISGSRIYMSNNDNNILRKYISHFPEWVGKVLRL